MNFTELLLAVNQPNLGDFHHWVFRSGMLFNEPDKWWGDRGRRDFPHEGVDYCLYEDRQGEIRQMGPQTRIPAIHDGVVKQLFSDYLGQAVVIEHEPSPDKRGRFISIYAHTRPVKQVKIGAGIKRGDVIATIADTSRSKATILPHLHYSLGYSSAAIDYQAFVWNDMRNPAAMTLMNPLDDSEAPVLE